MPSAEEKIRILPDSEEPNYQTINDGKVTSRTEKKTRDKSLLGIFLCILSGFFMIGGWDWSVPSTCNIYVEFIAATPSQSSPLFRQNPSPPGNSCSSGEVSQDKIKEFSFNIYLFLGASCFWSQLYRWSFGKRLEYLVQMTEVWGWN